MSGREEVGEVAAVARPHLHERLRRETAASHRAVEEATALPASVRTTSDYIGLLRRLHELHTGFENLLADPAWSIRWRLAGVDLSVHRRSPALARDLTGLGAMTPDRPRAVPGLGSFGHALGCLYVMEGSALGGRVLARAITARLGPVPTAFLGSDDRTHPEPWRAVLRALESFGESHGAVDEVVCGARSTFAAYGSGLSAWKRSRSVFA